MAFLVFIPGTVLPPRPLLGVLKDDHDARVADHAMRTAWRKAQGIPSTPDIDWQEEARRLKALLEIVEGPDPDAALVSLGHQAGLIAMSPAPTPLGEWSPPDGLDGVTVAPRALSASRRNTLRDAWRAAVASGGDARHAADALICEAIANVGGIEVYGHGVSDRELTTDTMEPLWDAGLAPFLLAAALHLTSLDAKKALRSGVRQPQT